MEQIHDGGIFSVPVSDKEALLSRYNQYAQEYSVAHDRYMSVSSKENEISMMEAAYRAQAIREELSLLGLKFIYDTDGNAVDIASTNSSSDDSWVNMVQKAFKHFKQRETDTPHG